MYEPQKGPNGRRLEICRLTHISWDEVFAYNWKLPAYNGAFLLTVVFGSFFAYNLSFLLII